MRRTNGVSAAFIRELLRKASVCAAEENGTTELIVSDRHLEEALGELLVSAGPMSRALLGFADGDVQKN